MNSKKKSLADDEPPNRNVQQPKVCVDYLSYQFDEMDLAASWRVMTKQKKDIVDGIRLENASWRTWAKQRNNLKTVNPQTLNWLKDSDVTWLYGPLHTVIKTEEDPFLKKPKQTAADKLDLMIPANSNHTPLLKPALKKIKETDILKRELSIPHRKLSITEANNKLHAISPVILANHRQPRLRFNHEVEQCVALADEDPEDISTDDTASEHEDEEEEIYTKNASYSNSNYKKNRKASIKIIAPARLKRSQSDPETESLSSTSSFNEGLSPYVTDDEYITTSQPNRPPMVTKRSSSSIPILKEKANVAEPALVTMNQTATGIRKDNGSKNKNNNNIFNHLATWASSYLWPHSTKTSHDTVYKEK
ncbi:Putative Regulation of carbohydrate metabolism-related protein [Rhizopus microsporus]|nr:Putative Regulation of carbohydrate metabolism-related protein [Rhizopus microsporus]